jgi:tetratricopeptide (TPR) repeat protein/peroxiredoxin
LGDFALSQSGKTPSVNIRRRQFLIRCCQSASAAMFSPSLLGFGLPALGAFEIPLEGAPDSEFHFHPHYRLPLPLDELLRKTQAELDDFVTEKYADQIAAILAEWKPALLQSPHNVAALGKFLLPHFAGASLKPVESRAVRAGATIEVRRNTFPQTLSLRAEPFLDELRSSLSSFSNIITAELQVTGIDGSAMPSDKTQKMPSAKDELRTRVRYELVGAGQRFHREQRVGYWELLWEAAPSGEFRLREWKTLEETQSYSSARCYVDITAAALGSNASYSAQLLYGTDYWRTVLDGACGIDIYGHNGVSVGDIDGDGLDDLYVCQPGGIPNRLYRNRGDGTFEDITQSSGTGVIENTACALFVDVNNDGHQDLIVVRSNGPLLFLNDGTGGFRQKANAFQFATPPQGTFTGAAAADYDRDGWLDIYFCLYVYYQGTDQYKYPTPYFDAENGPPNFMMRNNRDSTFRDATSETGLNQNNTRYSFCCAWNDFNGNGWPDLYVVNDFGRKNLYRNRGDGTFTDVAAGAGVEDVGAGMSVGCFDYDNDGAADIYVANMWTAAGERITMRDEFQKDSPSDVRRLYHKHAMGNSLLHNGTVSEAAALKRPGSIPRNSFDDRTEIAGVGVGRWAWSSDSWDFDHDGLPDLYIANGMVSAPDRDDLNSFFWRQVVAKSPDEAKPSLQYEQGWSAINELIRSDRTWSGYERNVFYANNGDGTFSDISGVVGLDFLEDGRSFALADFDLDGRQEVFLKNRNAPQLRLLKNVMPELPPSISFRLRGTKSNRDAIGAAITLQTDLGRQTRWLQAGSGFLSQHSKDVFFGLGSAKSVMSATIRWPGGLVQELKELPIHHRIWVEEGTLPSRIEPFRRHDEVLHPGEIKPQPTKSLPAAAETWLLAPVAAPDFSLPDLTGKVRTLSGLRKKTVLVNFGAAGDQRCRRDWIALSEHSGLSDLQIIAIAINVDHSVGEEQLRAFVREHNIWFPLILGSDDVAAVYNILYRYVFDRHRDLSLPTSFLIDAAGDIVKIYQGPVDSGHLQQDVRAIPVTPADRLARALPFPGVTEVVEFGRNYLSYGAVFFQRGYFNEAGAAFQIALSDDPDSAEATYGIGSVYLNQGKDSDARKCFERALTMRATYPGTLTNSWNNLGLLAGRQGRTTEAIGYFMKALRLSPDHIIALDNLGSAYRQLRQWDEARATYESALTLSPSDADASYGLGMVYAQLDDTRRAFELLQRALKARPIYPEALNNLGILYLRTQRRDQAVASFEESIRVAPDFDQAYLNLARVHAIEGNKDEARGVLQRLLQRHPDAAAQKMLEELQR